MKRTLIPIVMTILLLSSCQSSGSNDSSSMISSSSEEPEVTEMIVSTIKKNANGRTYLEVEGKPYLPIGAQIRLDGMTNRGTGMRTPPSGYPEALTIDELEPYVAKAKEMGFTVLQIPIDWRRLETSYDIYDFTFLDDIMTILNRHDMKMEILWFSTNMCGDTHSFHLPDYIWNDDVSFPKMMAKLGEEYRRSYWSWMYGEVGYIVLDTPALMIRESKMIAEMMNHVFSWNNENGRKFPIIGAQVHNESDGLLRWRHDQRSPKLDGVPVSKERLWDMTLNALNNAGLAFKSAPYKIVTRANMTVTLGTGGFPQAPFASPLDVYDLDGIDIIGDDPYVENPGQIEQTIAGYTFGDNFPHVAENMGHYASTPQLLNTAYNKGGAYYIYDFATPEFFVWMANYEHSTYQMDQGILNYDLSDKMHTPLTERIIKGIRMAHTLFINETTAQMAAFNSDKKETDTARTQTLNIGGHEITMKTDTGALGFVIIRENKIYAYATDVSSIKIDGQVAPYAQLGSFDATHTFVEEGKSYPSGEFLSIVKERLNVFTLR